MDHRSIGARKIQASIFPSRTKAPFRERASRVSSWLRLPETRVRRLSEKITKHINPVSANAMGIDLADRITFFKQDAPKLSLSVLGHASDSGRTIPTDGTVG